MTVGTKMHQTLVNLEQVTANLKSFALETEDQTAKQQFSQYSNQLENICQGLKTRINYIEQEEPQYKVFQNMSQQSQPQQQQLQQQQFQQRQKQNK